MHTFVGPKIGWTPYYVDGVETCEDAIKQDEWSGKTLGVRCPRCDELFFINSNTFTDEFGAHKRAWGFCTNCNHNYEAVINK